MLCSSEALAPTRRSESKLSPRGWSPPGLCMDTQTDLMSVVSPLSVFLLPGDTVLCRRSFRLCSSLIRTARCCNTESRSPSFLIGPRTSAILQSERLLLQVWSHARRRATLVRVVSCIRRIRLAPFLVHSGDSAALRNFSFSNWHTCSFLGFARSAADGGQGVVDKTVSTYAIHARHTSIHPSCPYKRVSLSWRHCPVFGREPILFCTTLVLFHVNLRSHVIGTREPRYCHSVALRSMRPPSLTNSPGVHVCNFLIRLQAQ